jgi:hypothetical protein
MIEFFPTAGCDRQDSRVAKEPYQPPELMGWGTLREITEKVGYRGAADGGRFPLGYKTSF